MSAFELCALRYDNLLAFMALLGLLRALDRARPDWRARAFWRRAGRGPFRPVVVIEAEAPDDDLAAEAEAGVLALAAVQDFGGRRDVDFTDGEYRELAADCVGDVRSGRAEVLAALASDAVLRDAKKRTVQPTPLCTMFGQGHQHFLERLQMAEMRETGMVPPLARRQDGAATIRAALFEPWEGQRDPRAGGFRWDAFEDRRYAYQYADPSSDRGKVGTVPGANRLAAVALPLFPVHPTPGGLAATGFARDAGGRHLTWPIWEVPARLAAIRPLLGHPELVASAPQPARLRPHGVVEVLRARRIQVDKFVSFSRGEALWGAGGEA
jgi:hypothetical protein